VMPDRSPALSDVRVNALSRWDNEGGAPAAIAQDLQSSVVAARLARSF